MEEEMKRKTRVRGSRNVSPQRENAGVGRWAGGERR